MDASARKQFELQAQVRHNAEEFKNAISGLYSWTKDIKDMDDDLQRGLPTTQEKEQDQKQPDPPIRSHVYSNSNKVNTEKENLKNAKNVESTTESSKNNETNPILESHAKANLLKDRGNSKVKIGDYNAAVADYTNAISLFPNDPIYFTNRALCYLKLEFYQNCIEDCDHALELDKLAVKAYYRRMQAQESLGNHVEALKDCTSIITIDPRNVEANRSLERINKRLQANKITGPSFSRSRPNLLDILPVDKPPYKRSKAPLKRIQVTDIVDSKDLKNFENEPLDITDEDIDKLFNSNCGPFVEVKKGQEVDKSAKTEKLIQDIPSNQKQSNTSAEVSKSSKEGTSKESINTTKNELNVTESKPQKIKPQKETIALKGSNKNIQGTVSLNATRLELPLPPAPQTTAQFYATWKDLPPDQKYHYLKSVELPNIQRVTGAGFDSSTLTDILYVLRDHYLPNNEPIITAQTLYEVSKNDQVKILSLLMSNDDKQVFNDILNFLKRADETIEYAQKIAKNFGSSI